MGLRIFYIILGIAIGAMCILIYRDLPGRDAAQTMPAAAPVDIDIMDTVTAGPQADLVVMEFMDYSCPYCREVHAAITEAVARDGRVTYVPRPLPSNDDFASHAALLAYTAAAQGKMIAAHDALMKTYKIDSEDAMRTLAAEAGLDMAAFEAAYNARSGENYIRENARVFAEKGNGRIPFFILGDDTLFVPEERMPTVEDFLKMFADARAKDKQ